MDKYDLQRFIYEQSINHDIAKAEILSGRKREHWMWYTFPQLLGLGKSKISVYYAIKSIDEAKAYIQNDTLRSNLVELCTLLLIIPQNDPSEVFCYPDDMKLKSSMTLFELCSPEIPVFGEVLDKFFGGERDSKTLEIYEKMKNNEDIQ